MNNSSSSPEAGNAFNKFANNIYDVHQLIKADAVVRRHFGSADELYANIARCANELRKGASVAASELSGSINSWKKEAEHRIFEYGQITVGNNAAGLAAGIVGWIPIFGQAVLAGQIISHAACGPETRRRRDRVQVQFEQAATAFDGVESIRGTAFLLTAIGNLPDDPLFEDAGAGILGLARLLARQDKEVTARHVKNEIEAFREISPKHRPGFSSWKVKRGVFYFESESLALNARLSQLSLSLAYLSKGILLPQLAELCKMSGLVRTTREFAVKYGSGIVKGLMILNVMMTIASVVLSSLALHDAIKTRDGLYDSANDVERQLQGVAKELVEAMKALAPA